MKIGTVLSVVLTINLIFNSVSPAFAAPPDPIYVQFSPSTTKGALYYPDPALFPNPHIAFIFMHRTANYLSHPGTTQLRDRGFVVLGMNPRCENNEAACRPWENNALDVGQGVTYLRKLAGIDTVILAGHSGGGPTMSFYQAVAENGAGFCQDPAKLVKCGNGFDQLPPADGIVFLDGHPGNGVNALRSLNPAVTNDSAVLNQNRIPQIKPTLDPFNPKNGFVEPQNGFSNYSAKFKQAYFKGQSDRMNLLIDEALDRMNQIDAGTYRYPDDDAFIVPRGDDARLMQADISIHGSTAQPRALLKDNGSIDSCCIVPSVRPPSLDSESNKEFGSSIFLTVRSFLSVRAIRSTDSIDGIDWCSSNNSTPCNIQNLTVPILVMAMQGHYFIRDSEQYFDMAKSAKKEFVVVEGATHGLGNCNNCGGSYMNVRKNIFDYVAKWANAQFP
jgi:pimeloyl-ACP methyl ester carboxylesterase